VAAAVQQRLHQERWADLVGRAPIVTDNAGHVWPVVSVLSLEENDRGPADPGHLDPHTDWMRFTHYSAEQPDLTAHFWHGNEKGCWTVDFGTPATITVHPHWL
jgi:hypothetical protein